MIALSIRQPWAHYILCDGKDVENRSWKLPPKHYGRRVLIHAGLRQEPMQACTEAKERAMLRARLRDTTPRMLVEGMAPRIEGNMHLGGIVGVVTLLGCARDSRSPWAESGTFHWLLADARPLPFHPCKGRLGFFEVEYPHSVEVPRA